MVRGTFSLSIVFAAFASAAFACSPVMTGDPIHEFISNMNLNKRVEQAPDCSFVNGGRYDYLEGDAAFDIGNGRAGQWFGWKGQEKTVLLVVMCDEGQAAVLRGVVAGQTDDVCTGGLVDILDVRAGLPPKGKFDLKAGQDFAGFLKAADAYGMAYDEDLKEDFGMSHAKDFVDLTCGCKVYYPDLGN